MKKGRARSVHDHFHYNNFVVGKTADEPRNVSVQLQLKNQSHCEGYRDKEFTIRIITYTTVKGAEKKVQKREFEDRRVINHLSGSTDPGNKTKLAGRSEKPSCASLSSRAVERPHGGVKSSVLWESWPPLVQSQASNGRPEAIVCQQTQQSGSKRATK